jgi:hypothetical protein
MTATSDLIRDKLSTGLTDWMVTSSEESAVVTALDADTALDATIRDLNTSGLTMMFQKVLTDSRLQAIVQIVAGRARGARALARAALVSAARPVSQGRWGYRAPGSLSHRMFDFPVVDFFDLCADLGDAVRRLGLAGGAVCAAPSRSYTGSETHSPFSGSAATGDNATSLGPGTAIMSRVGDGKNPISSDLLGYLRGLTPAERLGQAQQVVCQPISTIVPKVYAGGIPGRAFVMGKAGDAYQLEGRLIAAAILTEARDQSRREDGGEYQAARLLGRNTSIGLGQVVVSTARRGRLFSDLLSASLERRLSHPQIASLLASDEFNIFAVAKYVRSVADSADATPAASRAVFQMWQAGIDFSAFRRHSRHWPIENVRALGSEYTSRPWDARIVTRPDGSSGIRGIVAGWGELWGRAYETYGRSGISFR